MKKSSNISSLKYNPETKTLEVTFNNGQEYHYVGVTQRSYDAFNSADSWGKYLHKHIVPNHKGRKK